MARCFALISALMGAIMLPELMAAAKPESTGAAATTVWGKPHRERTWTSARQEFPLMSGIWANQRYSTLDKINASSIHSAAPAVCPAPAPAAPPVIEPSNSSVP